MMKGKVIIIMESTLVKVMMMKTKIVKAHLSAATFSVVFCHYFKLLSKIIRLVY